MGRLPKNITFHKLPTKLLKSFENKLTGYIGKPKDLWKALKTLALPNKISSCDDGALKINSTVEHL